MPIFCAFLSEYFFYMGLLSHDNPMLPFNLGLFCLGMYYTGYFNF
jgi:hypothetical protein